LKIINDKLKNKLKKIDVEFKMKNKNIIEWFEGENMLKDVFVIKKNKRN
jgi:hypothetical protein